MQYVTLKQYLDEEIAQRGLPTQLRDLLLGVSETCKEISYEVSRGALAGVLGMAGTENVSATTLWSRVALQPVPFAAWPAKKWIMCYAFLKISLLVPT